jgi:ankyrin repeat protein
MSSITFSNSEGEQFSLSSSVFQKDQSGKLLSLLNEKKVAWVTDKGETPLHVAAYFHAPACIEALFDLGAELEKKDSSGNTPLLSSLRVLLNEEKEKKTVRLLLEKGADPLAFGEKNQTATALAGNHLAIRTLIDTAVQDRMEQEL